ncbi:MAG: hypothetical protein M3433_05070 [Actinomycetota bacterium]|nr:hypothetical protein [Actinomycetota bacterium]
MPRTPVRRFALSPRASYGGRGLTRALYKIGGLCARHHLAVIGVWVLSTAGLVAVSQSTGKDTSDNLRIPGTDATTAVDLLNDDLPDQANGTNP